MTSKTLVSFEWALPFIRSIAGFSETSGVQHYSEAIGKIISLTYTGPLTQGELTSRILSVHAAYENGSKILYFGIHPCSFSLFIGVMSIHAVFASLISVEENDRHVFKCGVSAILTGNRPFLEEDFGFHTEKISIMWTP